MENTGIDILKHTIELNIGKMDVFNYALYQNGIAPIRDLTIQNRGESPAVGLSMRISADFAFFRDWEISLPPIPAGKPVPIPDPRLSVQGDVLVHMTEAVTTPVSVQLSLDGEVICSRTQQMQVLAYDQCPGGEGYQSLLSAFVLPNHPLIPALMNEASDRLRIWGSDPSLEGYRKHDPNRVRELAAAVYAAIQKKNIVYAAPPAGFYSAGQRIRTPETILETRLGTGMDLSLLYAACLEAIGLQPLLVMMESRIFTGFWLRERSSADLKKADLIIDNPESIKKMIGTGTDETAFIECTSMCSGRSAGYEEAEAAAVMSILGEEDFKYAIDIAVARARGIRPIPSRKIEGGIYSIDRTEIEEAGITTSPVNLGITDPELPAGGTASGRVRAIRDKVELWENKLLDLTTRNMLLSLPRKTAVIPLMSSHIDEVEDALADGQEFRLRPVPEWITSLTLRPDGEDAESGEYSDHSDDPDKKKEEPVTWLSDALQTYGVYEISRWPVTSTSDYNERIRQEFKSHRLYTFYGKKQLDRELTSLYRAARSSLLENGVSSLYLAIGLLRWYATAYDGTLRTEPCYAPLILMPVEIVRRPANLGYALQARDEEPHFNLTLLEMLRRNYHMEISGLDPLPEDEHGVDTKKTFSIVRSALFSMKHWDVVETCVIGNFSFAQFAMWKDIHTGHEMLQGSKVVRSLIKGHVDWSDSGKEIGKEAGRDSRKEPGIGIGKDSWKEAGIGTGKDSRKEAGIGTGNDSWKEVGKDFWKEAGKEPGKRAGNKAPSYIPVAVDATQYKAIEMASAGKTFVLHGPPGTGKSQTITGMIANLTAEGKTVLFVAEKMAALTVVQRRLEALGIGGFCLELHSGKANKKHVLTQLNNALGMRKPRLDSGFDEKKRRTDVSREHLDGYARSLHSVRRCGYSLRQLVDLYETVRNAPKDIPFRVEEAGSLTKEILQGHLALIGQLAAAGAELGDIADSPLKNVGLQSYSADIRASLRKYTEDYLNALPLAQKEYYRLLDFLRTNHLWSGNAGPSLAAIDKMAFLYFDKKEPDEMIRTLIGADRETVRGYYRRAFANQSERENLLTVWQPDLLERNLEEYLERHSEAGKKFFFKGSAMDSVTREIQAYTTMPLTYYEIPALLQVVLTYQRNRTALEEEYRLLSYLEKKIVDSIPDEEAYDKALMAITRSEKEANAFPGGLNAIHKLAENPENDRVFGSFRAAYQTLCEAEKAFNETLKRGGSEGTAAGSFEIPETGKESPDPEAWIRSEISFCEYIKIHTAEIKNAGIYNQAKEACIRAGLAPVVRAYESGMPVGDIPKAYRKGLYRALINDAVGRDDELSSFSGATFNEAVEQFKRLDDALREHTAREVFQILASRIPGEFESPEVGKELNILRKAIKSNGRSVSIRELFARIPHVLKRLCPCMLMSPNSAAQYLAQENGLFDVVIFDEASQLPTCKAVCAIARAENAVIVGDPRQMPPTSFFAGGGPEVNDVALYDLDSILDDTLALGIPSHYLKWHYRSTHESLIAFSNREFYENKMFTFPSADDRELHVTTVHVDSLYHNGTNPKEAEAIVAEIVRRFNDPVLRTQSVGVVTFNIKQQALIENLLAKQYQINPDLDIWANEEEDPLFVKNLENVQGDERDAILFSIGYGPDEKGFVSNNFGPINQVGGAKRLNVAFSRARISMTIFSSMYFTDIRTTVNSPEGVVAFRDFLKYADTKKETETPFDSVKGVSANHAYGVSPDTAQGMPVNHTPNAFANHASGVPNDTVQGMPANHVPETPIDSMQGVSANHAYGVPTDTAQGMSANYAYGVSTDTPQGIPVNHASNGFADTLYGISADHQSAVFEDRRSSYVPGTQKRKYSGTSPEDGILLSVCREIEKAGYQCDTMIGKSDFHVEIAVPDPNEPGRYMLGILLDGETYRQAGSTRDREIGQREVLKNLGWTLHRVWTMDWWDNRAGEIRRLHEILNQCRAESDERAARDRAAAEAKRAEENARAQQAEKLRAELEEQTAEVIREEAEAEKEPADDFTADTTEENPEPSGVSSGEDNSGAQTEEKGAGAADPSAGNYSEAQTEENPEPSGILSGEDNSGAQTEEKSIGIVVQPFNLSDSGFSAGIKMPESSSILSSVLENSFGKTEPVPLRGIKGSSSPAEVPSADSPADAMVPVPYRYTEFSSSSAANLSIREFSEPANIGEIQARMLAVLDCEAPILKDTMFRRILNSFGVTRTDKTLGATEKAFKTSKIKTTKQQGFYFCWGPQQNPAEYRGIRVNGERRPDELCHQEIRNAAVFVLRQKGSLTRSALIKETSLVLGYKRLGRNLETAILAGIQYACTVGDIRAAQNELLYLPN